MWGSVGLAMNGWHGTDMALILFGHDFMRFVLGLGILGAWFRRGHGLGMVRAWLGYDFGVILVCICMVLHGWE